MVVAGVDGSAGSRAALAHALDDAARRRCWLRVVAAFEPALFPELPEAELEAEVVRRTRGVVNDVLGHRRGPDTPPVSIVAVAGPPGAVLMTESEGAALLVVGHRGRGVLASAVLGSVTLHCLLNASCPVTVVSTDHHGGVSGRASAVASARP